MLYELVGPPTVETHSENVMRLYVRNANGAPVAGAHVKVWGGPPPDGTPPYFQDDLPYRMTNPSGLLEYFAVAGVMPESRDYWTRVIADDGTPQSDPVRFHFPQGGMIWITAVLEAAAAGQPGGTSSLPLEVQWDPRLDAMHVSIGPVAGLIPGQAYWKIISAQYQDETQSSGNHNFYYTVLGPNGAPASGVPIQMDFQGRASNDVPTQVYTDGNGAANYALYAGPVGWRPDQVPGPYTAWVGDPDLRGRNLTKIPGEKLVGAGLPMNRHVNFIVTWQEAVAGVAPGAAHSTIAGTISNTPSGTVVTINSETSTQTAALNADGTYSFAGLAAGTYTVSLTGVGVIASNVVLDGSTSARVDYAFPPPAPQASSRVSGVIQNAPTSLRVTLASSTQVFTTVVDGAGNYAFVNLPAGSYALSLAGIGIVSSNLSLDGTNSVAFNYTVSVQTPGKPVPHYLLFGSPTLAVTRTNLILALDYITRFGPTVGFSVAEAKAALNVTIVGAGAVSAADEQALKAAGCAVRHISGSDSYAVDQLFDQLISSGNAYPSS